MSHHAKLIKILRVKRVDFSGAPGVPDVLPLRVGTAVKNVEVTASGYFFEAKIEKEWKRFVTDEDFPIFTDKGLAHRKVQPYGLATMQPGRPMLSTEAVGNTIGIRLTRPQKKWMHRRCDALDESASEYVRRLLFQDGMPRQ